MRPGSLARLILISLAIVALTAIVLVYGGRKYVAHLDEKYHHSIVLDLPDGFRGLVEIREDVATGTNANSWTNEEGVVHLPVPESGVVLVREIQPLYGRTAPSGRYANGTIVQAGPLNAADADANSTAVFYVGLTGGGPVPAEGGSKPSYSIWMVVGAGVERRGLGPENDWKAGPMGGPLGPPDGACSFVGPFRNEEEGWSRFRRSPRFCGTESPSSMMRVTFCETSTSVVVRLRGSDGGDELFFDKHSDRRVARRTFGMAQTFCVGDQSVIASPPCEPMATPDCTGGNPLDPNRSPDSVQCDAALAEARRDSWCSSMSRCRAVELARLKNPMARGGGFRFDIEGCGLTASYSCKMRVDGGDAQSPSSFECSKVKEPAPIPDVRNVPY